MIFKQCFLILWTFLMFAGCNDQQQTTDSDNLADPGNPQVKDPSVESYAAPQVASMVLINAETGKEIKEIVANEIINLAYLPEKLAIAAKTSSANVGSIKFAFDSNINYKIENQSPYCLQGDINKKCLPTFFTLGSHTIEATPYTRSNASGKEGISLKLSFKVINEAVAKVVNLSLIDMKTSKSVSSILTNSDVITVEDLSSKCLSLRAELAPGLLGSVLFGRDEQSQFAIENSFPFDLMGDAGERGCLAAGPHLITVTPYSEKNATGIKGLPREVRFSLQENNVAKVKSLALVDMKTNQVLVNDISNSSSLPVKDFSNKCLSVRVILEGDILGSVGFSFNGASRFSTENTAPYDLMGDNGVRGCLQLGSQVVAVTPYAEKNLSGMMGISVSRSFKISEDIPTHVRANLLIEERFESSLEEAYQVITTRPWDYYGEYYRIFRAKEKPYAFGISQEVVRGGKSAARFEMRSSDESEGIIRSEIAGKKAESDRHRWYGFSLFLPKESWEDDSNWNIIAQWNGVPDPGEPARNPAIDLFVSNGRLKVSVKWAAAAINTDANRDGEKTYDLGPVEKDKWLDFVFHIKFSYEKDGILEVWKSGSKVIDHPGPNSYNDSTLPFFKIGLYKRHWGSISKRVIYGDEVRVGNGNATYLDVAP